MRSCNFVFLLRDCFAVKKKKEKKELMRCCISFSVFVESISLVYMLVRRDHLIKLISFFYSTLKLIVFTVIFQLCNPDPYY